jgi:hypothetical protein
MEVHMNNSVLSDVLLFGGMALWAIPGYVGAVWLAMKGYTMELIGCTILAGGVPILLPAVLGPLMLLAAWLLPHKYRRKEEKSSPAQPPAPPTQSRAQPSYKVCSSCGAQLRPGANFCNKCGDKQ